MVGSVAEDRPPGSAGGPLAFTFGSWFTWTAAGVAFPVLSLLLVGAAGQLARGAFETAPAFAATHVATLGWATMTIMGGTAQMAPALLGARVWGERSLPWQFGLYTLSVLALVAGLFEGNFAFAAAAGIGINVAAWWFAGLVAGTASRAGARRAVVGPQLPAAFVCFALVLAWGTVLAANLRWVFWPAVLVNHRGLVVHLTLGLGGWLGLMVVGVFYRLVPLVHGARVADARRSWATVSLAVTAVALVLAGVAWEIAWVFRGAAVLAAGGLLVFGWEILHVLARRRGRAPDLNVSHWHAVCVYSVVLAGMALGWALGWVRSDPPARLGVCVTALFLLGWVTQAIIGQLYKITPFLMWYYRATIPDVLAIPRQPAPYNPRPGRAVLWLSNAGVAVFVIGIWLGTVLLAQGGAMLLAAAAFVLAYLLAYRWIPGCLAGTLPFEWRWRIS